MTLKLLSKTLVGGFSGTMTKLTQKQRQAKQTMICESDFTQPILLSLPSVLSNLMKTSVKTEKLFTYYGILVSLKKMLPNNVFLSSMNNYTFLKIIP